MLYVAFDDKLTIYSIFELAFWGAWLFIFWGLETLDEVIKKESNNTAHRPK